MENPNDRSGRIRALKSEIKEKNEVDKTELIANASIKLGVTQSKVKEYIEVLSDVGDIDINDENIVFTGNN